ncbi:NADPH-dependent ferric siderophore reductase [Kribbella aluminosa]|uniref:NADPH-dependent ferric siderophore reductase n=1 Tax=Kribbella aluminosa TaxID=416017 RepID=A0ABS4UQM4_9ACTN|nr:siderophore-interacting protein [Kribbella aluminosa]MBP2353909.1 NADPH-dependent ferric siderophore reductase [Kribbella aluminosa]
MPSPAPRRNRVCKRAVVQRTERITPHMIRVVLTSDDFAGNGCTDAYVKLLFGKAGVEYPEPLDMGVVRETYPSDQWPTMRTYTVRSWDEATRELTIDFVHHGDEGVAGPWAASAQPGDVLWFNGPGGGYTPDEAADWHLLVGDESALPAIGAAVEQLAPGTRATVLVEVADETEQQKFGSSADVDVQWLHRTADAPRGDALASAVESLDFPPGTPHIFVHGEAGFVFRIRKNLFQDRALPRDRVSLSGYWRLGKNEDGWQAEKADTRKREETANN